MTRTMRIDSALLLATLLLALCAYPALAERGSVPGWFQAGNDVQGYAIGTVETEQGKAAFLKAIDPEPKKFGTLMQTFSPEEYLGKRVRFTARVKADDVQEWAGIWMRADAEKKAVAFDNMQDRPIQGTMPWTLQTIVLDIPKNADSLSIGILLHGKGEVMWDRIKLEIVGDDVPVTGPYAKKSKPANLNFED